MNRYSKENIHAQDPQKKFSSQEETVVDLFFFFMPKHTDWVVERTIKIEFQFSDNQDLTDRNIDIYI